MSDEHDRFTLTAMIAAQLHVRYGTVEHWGAKIADAVLASEWWKAREAKADALAAEHERLMSELTRSRCALLAERDALAAEVQTLRKALALAAQCDGHPQLQREALIRFGLTPEQAEACIKAAQG
jgi:hypothetical protein